MFDKPPHLETGCLTDHEVALIGYQRTTAISKPARIAWEQGEPQTLLSEVASNRQMILNAVISEIADEAGFIIEALRKSGQRPDALVDIGCGSAIADVFFYWAFSCSLTLIDIEETPKQYHGFEKSGAGYASLAAARRLLRENGVPDTAIATINPRRDPSQLTNVNADCIISMISCGFHYPIDEYHTLMQNTLQNGGSVILDLRLRHQRNPTPALASIQNRNIATEIQQRPRRRQMMFRAPR